VLEYPIDHMGIDGLWWNRDYAVRPDPEPLDPHFFGLTGALKLTGRIPKAPILVETGPEVPFVIPRALQLPGVLAVVSSLSIGPHVGYPIAYFADPIPEKTPRVNTWGVEKYWYCTAEGEIKWGEAEDFEAEYDYDLARWIKGGQLKWIAPGDEDLVLHDSVRGCPYVGLSGRQESLCVQDGEVWGLSDLE
jgi:hypothetical protein